MNPPQARPLGDLPLEAVLRQMGEQAVNAIDGCDCAGVSLMSPQGRVRTWAATDDVTYRVDQHQYDTGEGPCLDAAREGRRFSIDAMADEPRWPVYAPRAAAEGVVASHSEPIRYGDEPIGALNLYSLRRAFTPDEKDAAHALVQEFAVELRNEVVFRRARDELAALQRGLDTRDLIGQAKGVLMATRRCSSDEAFALLRAESQRRNVKLVEVAREVVERATEPG